MPRFSQNSLDALKHALSNDIETIPTELSEIISLCWNELKATISNCAKAPVVCVLFNNKGQFMPQDFDPNLAATKVAALTKTGEVERSLLLCGFIPWHTPMDDLPVFYLELLPGFAHCGVSLNVFPEAGQFPDLLTAASGFARTTHRNYRLSISKHNGDTDFERLHLTAPTIPLIDTDSVKTHIYHTVNRLMPVYFFLYGHALTYAQNRTTEDEPR